MLRLLRSPAVIAIVSTVLLVASSRTAGATPFELGTGVGANLGCIVGNSGPGLCNPDGDGDHDADFTIPGPINGAGYVSVTDDTDGFADTFFDYLAEANASFGKLQAGASGSYNLPTDSTRAALAFAYVIDQVTISAPDGLPQLDGTAGTLDLSFVLDGVLGSTGGGGAAMFAMVAWGQNPELFGTGNQFQVFQYATSGPHGPVPSAPILVSPVSFVWGESFSLQMVLAVGAGTGVTSLLDCFGGDACLTSISGTGSGTADFFHTMELTGLLPKDAQGNAVPDAQFSSGSGAVYATNGIVSQPVPEPGSLLLLGTGLALAVKRRRRG